MGNKFLNIQANHYFQCDSFTPIYFLPKITEEISDNNKENIDDSTNGKMLVKFQKYSPKIDFLIRDNIFEVDKSNNIDIDNYINMNINEPKNMKVSYYSKNICRLPTNQNYYNNLFIFDWDNTLLPTYYLARENVINEGELPLEYFNIFSLLEKNVYKLLKKCIEGGDTYIITNSDVGWVELSANKYFPSLVKLLRMINIISARKTYKDIYPDSINIWKEKAFLSLKEKDNIELVTNIICIGDSYIELEAGKKLAFEIGNCNIKSIKFIENPMPSDLIKQINLILSKFNYIISKPKNLSITIEQIE